MSLSSSRRERQGFNSSRSSHQRSQPRRNQRPFNPRSSGRRDGIASSARESSAAAYIENSRNNEVPDGVSQGQGISDQQERDDENTELCQVVMAVDMKERCSVGCCYYVADEQKLYLLEDITSGGLEAIESLKLDVQPTLLLLSTRADQSTSNLGQTGLVCSPDDQFQLPYHLDVRPVQEFNFEGAKLKLASLQLGTSKSETRFLVPGDTFSLNQNGDQNDLGFTDHQGRLLTLSGSIDMDNRISIGCAGAIITHLQRKRAAECLANDNSGSELFSIKSLEMRSLRDTMFVNTDTLTSLQVIQSESHPNAFNQGPGKTSPGAKESLSIYGLFHHFARTPQGKTRLKQRFLRPSTDAIHIKEAHDFISTYLRPDNGECIEKLTKSLKGIKNLRPVMVHVQKGISSGNAKFKAFKSGVWATLLEFAFHAIDVHETIRTVTGTENLDMHSRALEKLDVAILHQVGRIIHETVDLQSSIDEHRTVVKPRVDRELDDLKETYNGLDSLLNQVAINIAATIPSWLNNDVNVIYFPQLGFNIAMPLDERGRAVYDGGEQPWDQVFTTENRVYFKDFRMREMDERFGDIYGLICEKEIEIVYEMAQNVLQHEKFLVEASDICGEIDSLLALVQGASLYKLVRPQITQDNSIAIKGGRHLLHEVTVPTFIPNDTLIVGGNGREESASDTLTQPMETSVEVAEAQGPSMLLLTGPNFSGKSVYLKQVALIVYMSHIGSFVPAESAKIGITDRILTRITTRETAQSSFMIDLQQISFALNLATERSLVIIDEFGKGTESTDGAGLACGLFEYLLSLGEKRPKVLAATHFHEIFENGFLPPRKELGFGYMEVQVDQAARDVENQVTYLYNFRSGRSNASFGTNCAALNGIDPAIISRANEIGTLAARGEDLVVICAKMSADEMGELEEAESMARRFLGADFSHGPSGVDVGSEDNTERPEALLENIIGKGYGSTIMSGLT
ncbi:DNA mismatch repair protein MSH5 [Blastomyces parvus]|uniref:DNA mismatch repair protein MSH5 n=1 Tax=Blastomyces parvus TaxID=2060905 RepID=A0A2B7WXZ7_9EURO|nr:DNA mismatch repair protein MSH5 [Blastomyces parvus]